METPTEDQQMTWGLSSFVFSVAGGMLANSAAHPEAWGGGTDKGTIILRAIGATVFTAFAVYDSYRVAK